MSKQHTAGDWHRNGNAVYSDVCKDRGPVFECRLRTGTHVPADQNEVNAEYILRAVKSHDDLLAACKAALAELLICDENEHSIKPETNNTEPVASLRAAIAKAGGVA